MTRCHTCKGKSCPPRPINMTSGDPADLDAYRQSVWEWHDDHDPHWLHYAGCTASQLQDYLRFHKARRVALLDALRIVEHEAPGRRPNPLTPSRIAHHEFHAAAITALLPKPKPKRLKPAKVAPADQARRAEADHAAKVAAYAHTHGLSLRQAASVLLAQSIPPQRKKHR